MARSEIATLIKTLTEQGWTVKPTARGHYLALHPNGIDTSALPSTEKTCNRSWNNTIAQLRRLGADIPRAGGGKRGK